MDFAKLNIHMNFSPDKVSKIIDLTRGHGTRVKATQGFMDCSLPGLDPWVQESNCYHGINVMI